MTDQSTQLLARARELAVHCRYLDRELATRRNGQLSIEKEPNWSTTLKSWFGAKDPAEGSNKKLEQDLQRKQAALRMAINDLLSVYCDELRASPWYIGSLNSRDADLTEVRHSTAPQRRLIGRMREIRRSICDTGDNPLRPEWNPFVSHEYGVALDWISVCHDLSRVADDAVDAGLPDLRPHLQHGVYQPREEPNGNRLDKWMDRRGQTMRWTIGDGTAAISLTIPGVLAVIDRWLKEADRALAGQDTAGATQNRLALDDRILAAARAKLPDDLRQWLPD